MAGPTYTTMPVMSGAMAGAGRLPMPVQTYSNPTTMPVTNSQIDPTLTPPPSPVGPVVPGSYGNTFDQYDYLSKQFPGLTLSPGQTTVQGTPLSQFGRNLSSNPTFNNVLSPLYNPVTSNTPENFGSLNINPVPGYDTNLQGGDTFNQGQNILNNDVINDPQTQKVLDYIRSQGDLSRSKGIADAQALATARGISGSSTEQFGTAQAGSQADQATLGAQTQVLLQNLQAQQAARTAAANALFTRAGQQGTVGAQGSAATFSGATDRNNLLAQLQSQRDIAQQGNQYTNANTLATLNAARLNQVANLTSDQVASGVNQANNTANRAVQERLGNQAAFDAEAANQTAQKNSDRANDPFNLLIGGIGAGLPSVLPF